MIQTVAEILKITSALKKKKKKKKKNNQKTRERNKKTKSFEPFSFA